MLEAVDPELMVSTPQIDVIIAVHTPSRPIARALASVLDYTQANVRVTVIAHNTDPGLIRTQIGEMRHDSRLRIAHHADGIPSPTGPKNLGLSIATAPYVATLDSDDILEPGALDAWLAAARLPGGGFADAVIAPIRGEAGRLRPAPPIRVRSLIAGRRLARGGQPVLDGAKDRLVYRTAPLGLIGRERFSELRFAEGIETGEDQPFTAALWFTPASQVVFPVNAPAYIECTDQDDRVTHAPRSIDTELRALELMTAPSAVWARDGGARLSIAAKLLRTNIFDALRSRLGTERWNPEAADELAAAARRILAWEPRAPRVLARADARLLTGILNLGTSESELARLLVARSRLRSAGALVPHRARYLFHSQAPLRLHFAGARLLRFSLR